jgi:hypothetical protein
MDVGINVHSRVQRPISKQLAPSLWPLHPIFIIILGVDLLTYVVNKEIFEVKGKG